MYCTLSGPALSVSSASFFVPVTPMNEKSAPPASLRLTRYVVPLVPGGVDRLPVFTRKADTLRPEGARSLPGVSTPGSQAISFSPPGGRARPFNPRASSALRAAKKKGEVGGG